MGCTNSDHIIHYGHGLLTPLGSFVRRCGVHVRGHSSTSAMDERVASQAENPSVGYLFGGSPSCLDTC